MMLEGVGQRRTGGAVVKCFTMMGQERNIYINPISARGRGGNLTPPPVVFVHNSKIIGLRLLKFSNFS